MSTDDNDPEWGEWLYRGMPRVGLYVQIDCYHRDRIDYLRVEGWLRKVVDGVIFLDPPAGDSTQWIAYRWRVRKPRGMTMLEAVLRRVERTHGPRRSRVGEDA